MPAEETVERWPKVVRKEDDSDGGDGHFAVWIAMSNERGDVIHIDFDGPVRDDEAIACAEYMREVSQLRRTET